MVGILGGLRPDVHSRLVFGPGYPFDPRVLRVSAVGRGVAGVPA